MVVIRALAVFTSWVVLVAATAAADLGIEVPPGFEVSLYADDGLAHDIYSMTLDAQGRVVVAGVGYVKTLHDDDGDGRADRATLFSDRPAGGARGMYFDGPDLVCTGDNSVMRLRDSDGDGAADGPGEPWAALRNPEHGANGLVRGPDGCYYLVCGNDAGVSTRLISRARSPVADPRCGAVVRFSSDGQPLDVFAHGFRNPYDLAFDADGHLLTVDSDGERDHHLPWYAPTRLFDIAQGMEHGWLLMGWTRGWNRPPSYFDSVERTVEIGRGSPTGLVVYRHRAFGAHYRGGVFSACWTLGRVYYIPLEASGASCRGKLEVFAQTTSDVGFAPCDLAVGPQGDLYVAIGGRRTQGSVFRIRATGDHPVDHPSDDPLTSVLEADQPLASWSRARWVPTARSLGRAAFEEAAHDPNRSAASRVRAIEVLVEVFGGGGSAWPPEAVADAPPPVRTRSAWALGRGESTPAACESLSKFTSDADPSVCRAAWEALATVEGADPFMGHEPNWPAALSSEARRVRAAAVAVARTTGRDSYARYLAAASHKTPPASERLARLWVATSESSRASDAADDKSSPPSQFGPGDFETCLQVCEAAESDAGLRLEAVRLMQVGLGDVRTSPDRAEVYSGYTADRDVPLDVATHAALVRRLAPEFPTSDAELNRELARLLGMLAGDDPQLLDAITRQWTAESTVEDDVHYLIVASLLPCKRSVESTRATAACLLALHAKLDALGQYASRNWPYRVGEVFDALCRLDADLGAEVVGSAAFGHPGHALFAEHLSGDVARQAIRKLWDSAAADSDPPSAELVALVARLPEDEARPLVDLAWQYPGLRDPVVLALCRYPKPHDRARFVEALASPQPAVVESAARALVALGLTSSPDEMAQALRALKQACAMPKSTEPRQSLLNLLNFWTEENSEVDLDPDPAKAYLGWYKLFADYYPAEAAKLGSSSADDAESWFRRLAAVEWSAGDATRGRAVFERRSCHRCHEVSGHLGPELRGAVSRMSRHDLFMAIVDPNLEVAPAYQTTLVATDAGQVYHGLVVYESPESTLLQTGPDTTVRIEGAQQSSMRRSSQSLMPTGLLETLSDQDISDLHAYLQTLGTK